VFSIPRWHSLRGGRHAPRIVGAFRDRLLPSLISTRMNEARPLDPLLYARVGPLLDLALDLAPEARTQWLASLHGESPEVLDTLARLLADERASQELLPSGPGRYSLEQLLGGWATSLAGTPIGAWTLDALIGQGGMGTVWLAHRADGTFTGRAAIKLLHLSSVTPLAIEQFRREGTLLATLSHPNIARLLDAGVTETGQPYLVMEYVEGVPLDVYAREHRLTESARIDLVRQMLEAISHAHAHLIVHRDLKPSNILVRAGARVTLLDFGIGKQLMHSREDDPSAVTVDGGRALTPLFASPEQLRGEAIGTASDTYSAGVVAYQLLTGVHPTAGDSRTAADILRSTLESEPRRTALGDLDSILRKALRKSPGERYETAAAFNDDLGRYVEQRPVRARPDTRGYRMRRFLQRNRTSVAGASVALLALMATAGVAVRQAWRAERERDRAVFQAERAEATRQFQTLLMSQIGTTALSQKQLIDKGVQMFDAGTTTDPRVTISLLLNFADRYAELDRNEEVHVLLLRADSSARRVADVPAMFATACALARHYVATNNVESAQRQLVRAEAVVAGTTAAAEVDRVACLLARARLFPADVRDRLDAHRVSSCGGDSRQYGSKQHPADGGGAVAAGGSLGKQESRPRGHCGVGASAGRADAAWSRWFVRVYRRHGQYCDRTRSARRTRLHPPDLGASQCAAHGGRHGRRDQSDHRLQLRIRVTCGWAGRLCAGLVSCRRRQRCQAQRSRHRKSRAVRHCSESLVAGTGCGGSAGTRAVPGDAARTQAASRPRQFDSQCRHRRRAPRHRRRRDHA
jgi:hypothetical protein